MLVLGMHRSGTSALTRALSLYGCALPAELMGGSESNVLSNPIGHWESAPITHFNDQILDSVGSTWRDVNPLPQPFFVEGMRCDLIKQASSLLEQEFGAASLFVLKDPRISRLMPLWLRALECFKSAAVASFIYRSPREVAGSLLARNEMDGSFAELLWIRYVLDAEYSSREIPRSFVSYDELLRDGPAVIARLGDQLGISWPRQSDRAAMELDRFLSPQDRHHRHPFEATRDRPFDDRWLKPIIDILERWSRAGEELSDRYALDRIREDFDKEISLFSRPLLIGQQSSAKLGKLNRAHEASQKRAAEIEGSLATSTAAEAELRSALRDERTNLTRLRGKLTARDRTIQDLEAKVLLMQDHQRIQGKSVAAMAKQIESLAFAQGEAAARATELEHYRDETKALLGERAVLKEGLDRILKENRTLEMRYEKANAERVSLFSKIAARDAIISRMEIEFARLNERFIQDQTGLMRKITRWLRIRLKKKPLNDDSDLFATTERVDQRLVSIVANSPLFDADWYCKHYNDVALAGIDPSCHYVEHGAREGRDPGPNFDSAAYLRIHDDVAQAEMNPLVHYEEYGRKEARAIKRSRLAKTEKPKQSLPVKPANSTFAPTIPPRSKMPGAKVSNNMAATGIAIEFGDCPIGVISADIESRPPVQTLLGVATLMRVPGVSAARLGDNLIIGEQLRSRAASVSLDFSHGQVGVVDLSFISASIIRFRFECHADAAATSLRVFQFQNGKLMRCGAEICLDRQLTIADIALVDPFDPLLLILHDLDGWIIDSLCIPFPSLARGAPHFAELAAIAVDDYRNAFTSLSQDLLASWTKSQADDRTERIAVMEVDTCGALGTELIFNKNFLRWITNNFGIRFRGTTDASEGSLADTYLRSVLESAPRHAGPELPEQVLTMRLGAASIPSLTALVSTRPRLARMGSSFAIADAFTCRPRWSITLPQTSDIEHLQPRSAQLPFANIQPRLGGAEQNVGWRSAPLVIKSIIAMERENSTALQPLSIDSGTPLLRRDTSDADSSNPLISIFLTSFRERQRFIQMAQSVACQRISGRLECLLTHDDKSVSDLMNQLFEDRWSVINAGSSREETLNLLAGRARGRYFLLIDEHIVLHDDRTLATLAALCSDEGTATVSCDLIHEARDKRGTKLKSFGSAYAVTDGSDNEAEAQLIKTGEILQLATFPVLSQTDMLMMVRADAWRQLGGIQQAAVPHVGQAWDFCLRADAIGLKNLSTTAVTATVMDGDIELPQAGLLITGDQASRSPLGVRELHG